MKIFLLAIAFYYYLLYYIQRNHRERFRFLFSKNKNVFSSQVAHLHEYGKRKEKGSNVMNSNFAGAEHP